MVGEGIRLDLQRLFIYYFGELGASFGSVMRTVHGNPLTTRKWHESAVLPPTRFLPEFIAKIRASAESIMENGGSYACEYAELVKEAPKFRIKPRGYNVDPAEIVKGNRREYAHAMADAWAKCRAGIPRIFRYSHKIKGVYQDMMGCLFVLGNRFLPRDLRRHAVQEPARPCLAIAYKTKMHAVSFYAEDGRDITAPMIVKKAKELKEPVPLAVQEISDICLAFFRRNNFDPNSNLNVQIDGLCGTDRIVHYGRYVSNNFTEPHSAPGNGRMEHF